MKFSNFKNQIHTWNISEIDSNDFNTGNPPNQIDDYKLYTDQEDFEFKIEENQEILFASLISLFFRGNFTQSAFKSVIEFTQLLTPIKLPKDFDKLMRQIDQEKLNFTKNWFCQKCLKYVSLSQSKQRNCENCNTRFV